MIAASLLATAGVGVSTTSSVLAGPNDVEGTVFRDVNFDGAKAGEAGEAGIEITATDASGATVSTTSGSAGDYALDVSTLTSPVTIQFSIPASLTYLRPGPMGTDNRSDVVIASAGDENVDFGVINPAHYCQDNPDVITNCYIEGDQSGGGDVLVRTEYLADGDGTGAPGNGATQEFPVADSTDIGTTYGLAVQTFNDRDPANDVVWAAALMKRFAGYGPRGPDAIYRLDQAGAELGFVTIEAGTAPHDFTSVFNPSTVSSEIPDAASYAEVGKQAFGDIDLSEDQTELYAVNMFDRRLHVIDVDPSSVDFETVDRSFPLTGLTGHTSCGGEIRPGAVGVNDGAVFVGTTCDDASEAYVHRINVASGAATLELTIPLDYSREYVGNDSVMVADWRPWNDSFVATPTGYSAFGEYANPQPWLIDLEFDEDGISIGFRDRYGDQTGANAPSPDWPTDNTLYSTDAAGELLRACGSVGAYVLEGSPGCEVTNGSGSGTQPPAPSGPIVEWFDGDEYISLFQGPKQGHGEISHGGLFGVRTRNDVLMTAFDALDDNYEGGSNNYAFSQGLARLDLTSGDKVGQYRVVGPVGPNGETVFGKAAGLGDLEGFCLGAPVEIGNYVWLDDDADGVQDPTEVPLVGVTVTLSVSGQPDQVVVTGADGYYSFTVDPFVDYTLTFDSSTATSSDPDFLLLSPANQGSNDELDSNATITGGGLPTITGTAGSAGDNDHSLDVGFLPVENRIGNLIWLDANDNAVVDVDELPVVGATVQLFRESGDAPGFDAADIYLVDTQTDPSGNYWFDHVRADETYYVALPEDQSASPVTIDGVTVNPASLMSSTGGNLATNVVDNVDDGDPATGYISVSGPVPVVTVGSPLTETDANTGNDAEAHVEGAGAADVSDNDSNLTVDLGLTQKNRIGNLVWLDGALGDAGFNDGVADAAESSGGIEDVEVQLFVDSIAGGTLGTYDAGIDTLVATETTDANGEYWFNDVAPGDYFVGIPAGQTGQTIDSTSVDLADLVSSTATASDADAGIDDVDDGDPASGFASLSSVISVTTGTNPTDELGNFQDATDNGQEDIANAAGDGYVDGASDLTIDFGFVETPKYGLGNLIWFDADDSGTADAGELGIDGVEVQLWADGGTAPITTETTSGGGKYQFDDLPAGDYYIVVPGGQTGVTIGTDTVDLDDMFLSTTAVVDPDAAGDADNDSNGFSSGTDIRTGVVSIGDTDPFTPNEPTNEQLRSDDTTDDDAAAGDAQRNFTVDIGFVQPLRVGNLVWLDNGGGNPGDASYNPTDENDGEADANESGIAGVLVQLRNDAGDVIAETVTDANGNYWFDDLDPGDYTVGIPTDQTPELGAQPGIIAGATDGLKSSTGQSATAETADDDDDGEPAPGFLTLSNSFELEYGDEATDEGGDFEVATNDAAETAANTAGTFRPDENSNLEVDLGLAPLPQYRIGNLVWEDYDNDGIADAGEPGIPGVLVQLLDDADEVIAETVTGLDGEYVFAGLDAGDYRVRIPAAQTPELGPLVGIDPNALDELETSGIPATDPDPLNVDTDNNNDGVESAAGYTSGTLTVGEGDDNAEITGETDRNGGTDEDGVVRDDRSNLSVDFGFFRGLRLGNQIFRDGVIGNPGYDNGVFDAGEVGIGGVTVELWEYDGTGPFDPASDTLVATTTTDADGNYSFGDLDPGVAYIVAVQSVPGGVVSTTTALVPTAADNTNDGAAVAGYAAVTAPVTLAIGGATTNEQDPAPAGDDPAETELNDAGTTYPDGNSELAVDIGFIDVPLYRIGNLVWNDVDNSGTADDGELGIPGVLVQLLDDAGDVIAETVTDGAGNYSFENLIVGEYQVSIPGDQVAELGTTGIVAGALDGFLSSSVDATTPDDDNDNDDNGVVVGSDFTSGTISLGPDPLNPPFGTEPDDEETRLGSGIDDDPDAGQPGAYPDETSNYSVDFGFYRLTLGNQVWNDTNNNGVFDDGELPIEDVIVELWLYNGTGDVDDIANYTEIDQQVTGTDGEYLFTDIVDDATYKVVVERGNFVDGGPLTGFHSSTGSVSPTNDATDVDSDDNGIDPTGPLDGIESGPVVATAGSEPVNDADGSPTGEVDNDPTTEDGNEDLTVDFGFYTMALGDTVFIDNDNNGVLDGSDAGVPGVLVELYEDTNADGIFDPATDQLVTDTGTDPSGNYSFTGLPEGQYFVHVPPSNFEPGEPLDGYWSSTGNGAAPDPDLVDTDGDDNADPVGGTEPDGGVVTPPITLDAGTEPTSDGNDDPSGSGIDDANEDTAIDMGFYTLEVGNLVFNDVDNNELFDGADTGIADVTVELLDAGGDVVATTTTGPDGSYLFTGLPEGTYSVQLPPSNFADGAPLEGLYSSDGPDAADTPADVDADTSDVDDNGRPEDPATAFTGGAVVTEPFDLAAGTEPDDESVESPNTIDDAASNLSVDLGLTATPALELGNQVWFDLDNSGVFDLTESPVPDGVVVNLWTDPDGDGVPNAEVDSVTTTGGTGQYLFTGLEPGTFIVQLDPSNFEPGAPLAGFGPSTGPGVSTDPNDGTDSNSDAMTSPDAPGVISGPIVLVPGDEPTGEGNPPTPGTRDNFSNLTIDFGLIPGLELGNQIFIDAGNDGDNDGDVSAPAGVVVNLLDADGALLQSTETDVTGNYLFSGLPEGDNVVELPQSNFVPGGPLAGYHPSTGAAASTDPEDSVDGNSDGIGQDDRSIRTGVVTLALTTEPTDEDDPAVTTENDYSNLTVDIGVYALEFGDTVFTDNDDDGNPDGSGSPVPGVLLKLVDANGDPIVDAAGNPITSTTDENGDYLFTGLPEGEYFVEVDPSNFEPGGPLEGTTTSTPTNGTDTGVQSGNAVVSGPISLVAGVVPEPSAFGFTPTASVGDTVFFDLNGNGVQDSGEVGVPGVELELVDSNGGVVSTDTSDSNGIYGFTDLPPGDYTIRVVPGTIPTGASISPTGRGTTATDNNIDPTTLSSTVFTLDPGENDPTIDVGIFVPGELPRTGSDGLGILLRAALILSLLGAGFVLVTRRPGRDLEVQR